MNERCATGGLKCDARQQERVALCHALGGAMLPPISFDSDVYHLIWNILILAVPLVGGLGVFLGRVWGNRIANREKADLDRIANREKAALEDALRSKQSE